MKLIRARRINNYKTLILIQHAEKPQELFESFDNEDAPVESRENHSVETTELDKAGFENFKAVMRSNPRMVVKE